MFLIRSIEKKDLDSFYGLASILNTYNLPKNRALLSKIIHLSLESFRGKHSRPEDGRFVFVAEDTTTGTVIGTSEILARRGVKNHPFIYCDVGVDVMKSRTLKQELPHRYIRLNWTEEGATEVGGLVVDPKFRGKGLGVGKTLAYARFMYMKSHPQLFQKKVIAELLAYLNPRGENPLWNVLGAHFTGLSYREADRLSMENKEFILSLFPREKIYTCLLPDRVQEILEKPGPHSIPAKVTLEKIGFKYLSQIDPFDGGPMYGAKTQDIKVVKGTRCYVFSGIFDGLGAQEGWILADEDRKVRACRAPVKVEKKSLFLNEETAQVLGLKYGKKVWGYL